MEEEKKEEEKNGLEVRFLILGLMLVLILDFLLPVEKPVKSLAQGWYHPVVKLAQEKETRIKHRIIKIEGRASWYGLKFHGRTMANGEIFNKNAFTMATNLPKELLALNTKVRIINPANKRSVLTRVTDRGPWALKVENGIVKALYNERGHLTPHHERKFDLSEGLAQYLGFKKEGVGNVIIEFLVPADS